MAIPGNSVQMIVSKDALLLYPENSCDVGAIYSREYMEQHAMMKTQCGMQTGQLCIGLL